MATALTVGVVGLVLVWWRNATSFKRVAGPAYYSTLPPGNWGLPIVGEFIEFMFTQQRNHGEFVETRKAK